MFLTKQQCKKWIWYWIGIFVYRVVLDLVFIFYISPLYAYYMDLTTNIQPINMIASYVLLGVIMLFMSCDDSYLSDILLNVQLVVMLMPMLTLCAISGSSLFFMMLVSGAHILQCLCVKVFRYTMKKRTYIFCMKSGMWMKCVLMAILVLSVGYSFSQYGFASAEAFDLTAVYGIREQVGYSFPFSYLVPWAFKVICLFLLVYALEKKHYILAEIAGSIQIYFYLTYANKSTLFSLILVLGSYFIVNKTDVIKTMIIGLIALMSGSSLVYACTGNLILLSYLVRRTFFVPARIKFAYYEFFSQNLLLYFADNSIGHLFGMKSPYEMQAPKLIAEYLGEPQSYCNTGYWGDAYANFGSVGVLLFSLILILLVLAIENMKLPKTLCFPLMIALFYNLNDGALLTWILGGGGALIFILLWLYRNVNMVKTRDAKI